jgi:Uma2 family endonuclease
MPDTARRYTVDDVLAFPDDGNRYELVDGELLVTPAPSLPHQVVLGDLQFALATYLKARPGFMVLASPADISWDREKLVQPDLFVIPATEVSRSWKTVRTLLLAVEVVSPSSARGDRLVKRRLYQRQRVATYWIVDPDARLVEVWHPDDDRPEIVTDTLRWRVAPDAAGLVIDLPELFQKLPT